MKNINYLLACLLLVTFLSIFLFDSCRKMEKVIVPLTSDTLKIINTSVNITVVAPCTPINNNLTLDNTFPSSFDFTYVSCKLINGNYTMTANSTYADLIITLGATKIPSTGKIYTLNNNCPTGFISNSEVCIKLNLRGSLYYPTSGSIYVNVEDTGITASFCNLGFNGNSLVFYGTGKITCQ